MTDQIEMITWDHIMINITKEHLRPYDIYKLAD